MTIQDLMKFIKEIVMNSQLKMAFLLEVQFRSLLIVIETFVVSLYTSYLFSQSFK